MADQNRSIQELMDELNRINQEYRQKLSDGMSNPDSFMKLSEIERLGRELSKTTQNLYLEQTISVLDSVDETVLIRKKKRIQRKRNQIEDSSKRNTRYTYFKWKNHYKPI